MKLKTILLTACAAFALTASSSFGAIGITFSGGGGSPLSITLPAMSWEITNAAGFNASHVFGIAIAVGQTPVNDSAGSSLGGNTADWSSDGATTFPNPLDGAFYKNNAFGGPADGSILWFGIDSSQTSSNGEVISYAGGTISNNFNIVETFVDGDYATYLVSGGSAQAVSTADIAVPEPSTYAAIAGLAALGFVVLRRKRAAK